MRFLVCIHDATPAYARETRAVIRDLAPLLGRRFAVGVVPDWHGEWPLEAHPEYCRLVKRSSAELLLHGYYHRRRRGCGPITLLTGGSDEMNGLNREETRSALSRGQSVFAEVFGHPAQGFIAPGWQAGHVRWRDGTTLGLNHVVGFFALRSSEGGRIPLVTWTWDCGRWGWMGRVGERIGWLLQSMDRGVPTVAIHPRDVERGFWPRILRLIEELLGAGYEPGTPKELLETVDAQGRA